MISFRDKHITVFGLGHHGGGVETVKWCVAQGARVTVCDALSEQQLARSLEQLRGYDIRYSLGAIDKTAITAADVVIKNPAVPRNLPLLRYAKSIETDLSIFLKQIQNKIIAVTGTKGKSTTASAIAYALNAQGIGHALVGNIGTPVLSILNTLHVNDIVVLEVSSFQLGDLRFVQKFNARHTSAPSNAMRSFDVALCTNIFSDHRNYYRSHAAYIRDKIALTQFQSAQHWLILPGLRQQRAVTKQFIRANTAQLFFVENEISARAPHLSVVPNRDVPARRHTFRLIREQPALRQSLTVATTAFGMYTRINLQYALAALACVGITIPDTVSFFADWSGIKHRMETIATKDGITFINDSAATIPRATAHALAHLDGPIYLIAGGSDKKNKIDEFITIYQNITELFLLVGAATERIMALLQRNRYPYFGPYASLAQAFAALLSTIEHNRRPATVLLSPGCASFGMFLNEFDRGDRFRALVMDYVRASRSNG